MADFSANLHFDRDFKNEETTEKLKEFFKMRSLMQPDKTIFTSVEVIISVLLLTQCNANSLNYYYNLGVIISLIKYKI